VCKGPTFSSTFFGEADKTTSLTVQPGATCASTSNSNSNYLSIATAGFQAWFTLQAKDQYKNLRTIGDNNFVLRLSGPHSEEHNLKATYVGGTLVHQQGKFSTQYRTSRSGNFAINVLLAETQGLNATYYRDPNTQAQVLSRIDSKIQFNWGLGTPDPQVGVTDSFSVYWKGFVKAPATGRFTFGIATDGADERIQLWVDNRHIIDSWTSTHALFMQATIMLNANVLYDIKMRYNDLSGKASVDLQWKYSSNFATIPSDHLFAASSHIMGSPFSAYVYPALTCGSSSTVTGDGVSLATAGIPASFTITAKDHLGNLRTTEDDIFVVRARPLTRLNMWNQVQSYATRNILGTVTSLGNGLYAAVVTPTKKAHALSQSSVLASPGFGGDQPRPWHDVLVSLAKPGGLFATFYVPNNFEGASTHLLLADTLVSTPSSSNSFRFSGFFRPTVSTMYTFVISTPGSGNLLKLHIDGKQVVHSTTILSGTMQFFSINALYDVYIEAGSGTSQIPSTMSLKYICCGGNSGEFIPSGRLFQSQDLTHKTYEFQGLFATYYFHGGVPAACTNTPWTNPDPAGSCVTHLLDSTIDWSGVSLTDRPYSAIVPSGAFSVRWEGFVRPSRRDRYTFFVHTRTSTAGIVKLSVDNVEIIGPTVSGVQLGSSGIYEFSGTIQFPLENDVYDITLHYNQASQADRQIALLWQNTGATYSQYGIVVPVSDWVNKSIIPSDRLSKIRSRPVVVRDDSNWWTFPASPCLGTSVYTDISNELEYRECRGIGVSINDILHVDVKPNVACASTSLIVRNDVGYSNFQHFVGGISPVHGPMVTLTTAGSVRSFDIVIRDEYFNVRNGRDEAIMSRQYLTSEYGSQTSESSMLFHGTISFQPFSTTFNPLQLNLQHDPEGHYTATYLVTVAGDFQQEVSIAGSAGNGIAGTYFIGASLNGGSVNRVETTFDFNWGNSTPTTDSSMWGSLWSVRFAGYIKVPNFEVITFTSIHEGSVQLWVNSILVIQRSPVAGTSSSGTVFLSANVLYDIRLEFSKTTSNAQVQLRYSSASITNSVIPSSVLFPYKRVIGNGLLPLNVEHAIICATTSRVMGPGLTIATTGIPAFFTIQSRDEYQNLRIHQNSAQSGCDGFFCQDCSSISTCLLSSTLVLDSPANSAYVKRQRIATIAPHSSASSSLFAMMYTYTKAGTHTVQTSYMKPGGLMATYYDDTAFAIPRRAIQELPVKTSSWTRPSIVNDGLFCVRWAGSVQVPLSVNPTTFVVNALVGDQYRLYVDEALVIDKWAMVATNNAATTSGTIMLNSAQNPHDFYNILLEYKSNQYNTLNIIELQFGGSVTTTSNLFRRDHISGTSKRLRINPNIACSVTSTHRGVGLTLATAGLQAMFTITSIDAYGNQRGVGGDTFVVRAFPLGLSTGMILPPLGNEAATGNGPFMFNSCTSCCVGCPSLVRASVVDRKDNTYLVSYTPTKRGDYKMVSSLARIGGLTATVYSSSYNPANPTIFGTRVTSILEKNIVDFSVAANANLPNLGQTTGTWRWQGFIQPSKAAQYTFFVTVKHASEKVLVWMDNNLLMSYSGSGTDVSATFGFGLADSLYDIDVIYSSSDGSQQRGITLMWESLGSTITASNVIKAVIPRSALWSRHDIENMDIPNGDSSATAKNWMYTSLTDSVERKLFVQPSVGCASMSTSVGNALTLATAGLPATFTIFSKDMWQNSRSIQNDMVWVGTAFGSGGVPTVLATVTNIRSSTVTSVGGGSTFTTSADHGLAKGDSIQFSVPNFVTHKLPAELNPYTYYYVLDVPLSNTFTIATTKASNTAVNPVTFVTQFFLATNAYRVSYTINSAKQFSFFAKSSNFNAMNSPFSLTVVPHRQCGTQSTVFGSGISSAVFNSVTAFTIVARDFYGNRRTIANDGSLNPDDVYLASVVYSSVPSAAPWSFKSDDSVATFNAAAASAFVAGTFSTSYIVQATTTSGTGSGAVFRVEINTAGTIIGVYLVVGGYGYAVNSQMKLFKEHYGSNVMGDITITVLSVQSAPGLSAVLVTSPCVPPLSPCNNAQPSSVGDGTYTGAYTLTTMPPGAAYAGAYFRAFLGVRGGLMATFYSAATDPTTSSLDVAPYVRAETRIVNHGSSPFTCSNCFAGARFHGFFKATGPCSISIGSGTTRTYISGQIKHDAWAIASGVNVNVDGNCQSGQYVEIYQESRASQASSHSLFKLDTTDATNVLVTGNLFAAYAISNTPVPLTVTK